MVDKAREIAKGLRMEFFQESVTDMKNQEDGSFDVVMLMNGVLDYCRNHVKALQESSRVLKKGGIIIGTVNNRMIYLTTNILLENKDPVGFVKAFESGNYKKSFPIHDFTAEELEKSLSHAGFEMIDILGPTNLLRKWEYDKIVNEENRDFTLDIQLKFSKKKEYLNNSTDFFFVARKL